MITTHNGILTYSSFPSPLLSWRPDNDIVFVLLVALVTTLISYHTTSIFFDITLGHKPRHCAKVSDLLINRLALSASPLAIFRNVFVNSYKDLQEAVHFVPQQPANRAERHASIPLTTLIKLFFLLAVAPIMNIAAIILSTEYETELTFMEAGFERMSAGLNRGLSALPLSDDDTNSGSGDSRIQIPIYNPLYDSPLVRLNLERSIILVERPLTGTFYGEAWHGFTITLDPEQYSLVMEFVGVKSQIHGTAYVTMEFMEGERKNDLYRIELFEDLDALSELHKLGAERLLHFCGTEPSTEGTIIEDQPSTVGAGTIIDDGKRDERREITKMFNCDVTPELLRGVQDLFLDLMKKLTVIDSNEALRVRRDEDSNSLSVEDELFVRRRGNYVGLAVLLIIVSVLFTVRIGTAFLTRNDVSTGTGFVIRFLRDMHCCDTMLIDDDDIRHSLDLSE